MLGVLLVAECSILVSLILCALQGLPEILNLFLEVFHLQCELKLSFGETLGEVADDLLSFLDLCRVGVVQSLHLVLVLLAEVGELIFGFFLTDYGLSLRVTETLHDALMVLLLLSLLFLLLLQLQLGKLQFLLCHSLVLDCLTLNIVALLFQFSDEFLKLLYPQIVGLSFCILSVVIGRQLSLVLAPKGVILRTEVFLEVLQHVELLLEFLLPGGPLLPSMGILLLIILLLALQLEDLLTEFLDLLTELPDLTLVLLCGLFAQTVSLKFLVLQFMDQLFLFLVLLGCLLLEVLNLLLEESLLLVEFRLRCPLQSSDLLLLLNGEIHAFCHLLDTSLGLSLDTEDLVFRLSFQSLTFFESLLETLSGGFFTSSKLSLQLLCLSQFGHYLLILFSPVIFTFGQILLQLRKCLL